MREKAWLLFQSCLVLLIECYLVVGGVVEVEEKAEAATPLTTSSPPEGNTTFLYGTTWCVARPAVSQSDLQNALDWACGLGMADCRPIQSGGPCFQPNNLVSHASYAFNFFYQQNGNSDVACNFGGTATLTKTNPSYGKCVYASSESAASSSAPAVWEHKPSRFKGLRMVTILVLLYMGN